MRKYNSKEQKKKVVSFNEQEKNPIVKDLIETVLSNYQIIKLSVKLKETAESINIQDQILTNLLNEKIQIISHPPFYINLNTY